MSATSPPARFPLEVEPPAVAPHVIRSSSASSGRAVSIRCFDTSARKRWVPSSSWDLQPSRQAICQLSPGRGILTVNSNLVPRRVTALHRMDRRQSLARALGSFMQGRYSVGVRCCEGIASCGLAKLSVLYGGGLQCTLSELRRRFLLLSCVWCRWSASSDSIG